MNFPFAIQTLLAFSYIATGATGECVNGVTLRDDFNGSTWPKMWRLMPGDLESPQILNKLGSSEDVPPEEVAKAGLSFEFFDPSGYEYPIRSIPWEPIGNGTSVDPRLVQFRSDFNYSYADIITVTGLIDKFWEEHHHAYPSVRYILNGTGYFDIRDANDEWVRISAKAGDFMVLPAGINHRFTVDENNFITAMRLFSGSPVWTSYRRDEVLGNLTARNDYVDKYLCGVDPDVVHVPALVEDDTSSASAEDDTSSVSLKGPGTTLVALIAGAFMNHLFSVLVFE